MCRVMHVCVGRVCVWCGGRGGGRGVYGLCVCVVWGEGCVCVVCGGRAGHLFVWACMWCVGRGRGIESQTGKGQGSVCVYVCVCVCTCVSACVHTCRYVCGVGRDHLGLVSASSQHEELRLWQRS